MKFTNLIHLISQNIRRNRKNLAFSTVGIVVGICSFVFFIALGSGIKRVVATEIFPVDANRFQIVPRTAQFDQLSGGRVIDDEALDELRAVSGVKTIYPRMKLAFLASTALDGRNIPQAALNLLGRVPGVQPNMVAALKSLRMWLEIIGDGIDPRLVQADATAGSFSDPGPGEPIPVLLSKNMVEIYNSSFAKTRSLPRLDERMLPFVPALPLTLNHSFLSPSSTGRQLGVSMKVVGLSRHALMGGITVPLETARKYNRMFAGEQAARTYDAAIVEVTSSDHLGPAQEAVERLGFEVDASEQQMAKRLGLIITLVTLGFTLISLIIVGIAAINITHTFFMIIFERKRELGLLRALGAARKDVRHLILGEATFVGVLGGGLGLLLGLGMCLLVDLAILPILPDFPFKPDSFFAFPGWLFVGAFAFSVMFCWLGAIFPAQRAARLDPAQTLSGR